MLVVGREGGRRKGDEKEFQSWTDLFELEAAAVLWEGSRRGLGGGRR